MGAAEEKQEGSAAPVAGSRAPTVPPNLHQIDGGDRRDDPYPLGVLGIEPAPPDSGLGVGIGSSARTIEKYAKRNPSVGSNSDQSQSCFGAMRPAWARLRVGGVAEHVVRAGQDPCSLSRFLVPPGGTLLSYFARSHMPMREANHSERDDLGCPPPSRHHPYRSPLPAQDKGGVQIPANECFWPDVAQISRARDQDRAAARIFNPPAAPP